MPTTGQMFYMFFDKNSFHVFMTFINSVLYYLFFGESVKGILSTDHLA